VPPGLAQSKHGGPIDGDPDPERQLRGIRGATGESPRAAPGLPLPARAWIVVLTAAGIWVVIALVVALIF
jgi:hypothetical protein